MPCLVLKSCTFASVLFFIVHYDLFRRVDRDGMVGFVAPGFHVIFTVAFDSLIKARLGYLRVNDCPTWLEN